MALSKLRIAGITMLFIAFFLSFLASISLPTIRALDIARITDPLPIPNGAPSIGVREARFGIWSFCEYFNSGSVQCNPTGHGYTWPGLTTSPNSQAIAVQPLQASWTRGLAIHPVATAFAFIGFCLVFTTHTFWTLLVTALAALLTLLAFAVDIALYAKVHNLIKDVQVEGIHIYDSKTGAGFWLTFVSLILLIIAGVVNLISHRSESYPAYPSYPMSSSKPSWLGFLKK
ncbi:hypothetical protein BDP27DRAFT_1390542 [Rhodocollybia butyracea]|uniref:Pali-domain-containing protein n=1 Tax=Rhodocollybia butyracea TaxID=206335 RepID=A0A9P5Q452_9AGAR|nr:hypothetical protein BDP27DRAFT_1390542 [Rhodocollybia butyracea]